MRRLLIPFAAFLLCSCSSSTDTKSAAGDDDFPVPASVDAATKEPGAVKTASGMVYRERTPGTGASPKETDTVTVNYRGRFTDGKEFDASNGSKFPLNQVIACWTEGVQKMKVGGRARLTCPGNLAYSNHPPPGSGIPPDATLVFDVELVGIGG